MSFLVLLLLLYCACAEAQICFEGCGPKRFLAPGQDMCGYNNTLRCYCEEGCTSGGDCRGRGRCRSGHTGLYCQYYFWNDGNGFPVNGRHLACMNGREALYDDDLGSCETGNQTELLVTCPGRSFLYVEVTHSRGVVSPRNISIQPDGSQTCYSPAVVELDDYTSHVFCSLPTVVARFRLVYSGVHLCEVRMVVGQDVASQQRGFQTAMVAGDQVTGCVPVNDRYSYEDPPISRISSEQCTCARTPSPHVAFWGVSFFIPSFVFLYSFVLGIGLDPEGHCEARVVDLAIKFFSTDRDGTLYDHHWVNAYVRGSRYTRWDAQHSLYSQIKLINGYTSLPVCRFNAFGEHSCARGTYGPHCGLRCSCNHGGCAVASGLCPKGVLNNPCTLRNASSVRHFLWGPDCLRRCHCASQCDRLTGRCSSHCVTGTHGFPYCDNRCYCEGGCQIATARCQNGCTTESHSGIFCNETCVRCRDGVCDEKGRCVGAGPCRDPTKLAPDCKEDIPLTRTSHQHEVSNGTSSGLSSFGSKKARPTHHPPWYVYVAITLVLLYCFLCFFAYKTVVKKPQCVDEDSDSSSG